MKTKLFITFIITFAITVLYFVFPNINSNFANTNSEKSVSIFSASNSSGRQNIALIVYNLNQGSSFISSQDAATSLQNNLNSFWGKVSYGKLTVKVDGYGPYNGACSSINFIRDALNAGARDIYYPDYSCVFILTSPGACGTIPGYHTGATPTRFHLNGQDVYLSRAHVQGVSNLSNMVALHEFGHTLGLSHVLADHLDIMSYSGVRGLNAVSVDELGWLDSSNVLEINDNNKYGRYELSPLETLSNDLKVLKIPTKSWFTYYISFRPTTPGCFGSCYGLMINTNNPTEQLDADSSDLFSMVLKPGQTYYNPDPLKEILISAIEENGKIKAVFDLINCGDNKIDVGEECDGSSIKNTCENIGFESGKLQCDVHCKFDISQCENRICRSNDEVIGERECKAIFTSDFNDNYIYSYAQLNDLDNSVNKEAWNDLRMTSNKVNVPNKNLSFYYFGLFSNYLYPPTPANPIRRDFIITRIYTPFNTSSLPDSSIITSGNILLHVLEGQNRVINSHSSSEDFLTLVPVSPENIQNLNKNDFTKFGDINNPIELGTRFDISQNYDTTNREILFELNKNGKQNINTKGFSNFGIRSGYDLKEEIPNNNESTQLSLWIKSSNPSPVNTYEPPILNLTYKVPYFSYIQNKSNKNINGALTLSVEKNVEKQWIVKKTIFTGSIAIPANTKIDLNSFWTVWKPDSLGVYRVKAELKAENQVIENAREFSVAGNNCGNNVIDNDEICDSSIIGKYGTGVGQCKNYSDKYIFGDLKCNSACLDYDVSSCISRSDRNCLIGDIDNHNGTCTAIFESDIKDGFFTAYNDNLLNWDEFKQSESANLFDKNSSKIRVSSLQAASSSLFSISRGVILFDTNKLDDKCLILSGKIKLRVKENGYVNNTFQNDFVFLTGINIDKPNIELIDFGKANNIKMVDNLSSLKIRGLLKNTNVELPLNGNGIKNINKNGWTNFALKTGLEFFNSTTTYLSISAQFYSSNSTFKPKLEIVYVP